MIALPNVPGVRAKVVMVLLFFLAFEMICSGSLVIATVTVLPDDLVLIVVIVVVLPALRRGSMWE